LEINAPTEGCLSFIDNWDRNRKVFIDEKGTDKNYFPAFSSRFNSRRASTESGFTTNGLVLSKIIGRFNNNSIANTKGHPFRENT
jgi:hypothetical protein